MPTSLRGTGAAAPRLRGRYVADFFSGCGGVARAVRRQGFQARERERLNGENFGLMRPCVLRHIEQEASQAKILAAMLAPPCGSFSGINRQDPRGSLGGDSDARHGLHGGVRACREPVHESSAQDHTNP